MADAPSHAAKLDRLASPCPFGAGLPTWRGEHAWEYRPMVDAYGCQNPTCGVSVDAERLHESYPHG